jgi:aarF domain-containing kinase
MNLEHFKDEMGKIFADVQKSSLGEVRVGQLMTDVLTTVRNHYVKMESNFATLVMGTMVLEGLGKQLDPTLNLIKVLTFHAVHI